MKHAARSRREGLIRAMLVTSLVVLLVPLSGSATSTVVVAATGNLTTGVLATFDVGGERFKLWVTNPKTVQQLKDLKKGRSQASIPNGRIHRGPGRGGYNAPWNWHFDRADVQMAEVTTEVCDGRPSYVQDHIRDFVQTVKRYCPWSAKLVKLQIIVPASRPGAPSNLRVVSVKKDSSSAQQTTVQLRWRDNTSGETGFRVHTAVTRMYGDHPQQLDDTVGPDVTTATVSFIAGGFNWAKKVCFDVTAITPKGPTDPSPRVCMQL